MGSLRFWLPAAGLSIALVTAGLTTWSDRIPLKLRMAGSTVTIRDSGSEKFNRIRLNTALEPVFRMRKEGTSASWGRLDGRRFRIVFTRDTITLEEQARSWPWKAMMDSPRSTQGLNQVRKFALDRLYADMFNDGTGSR